MRCLFWCGCQFQCLFLNYNFVLFDVHIKKKKKKRREKKTLCQIIIRFHHENIKKRRGLVGLPTRLTNKGRAGSVQAGTDDGSLQDESSLDGEENEKQ